MNEGEYERLLREFARTAGTRTEALEQAIYNDGEILTRYVQNRIELAMADVLVDGVFSASLASEFGGILDFGVPGSNLVTVGTSWATTATSDPFADLLAACDLYESVNGERPGFGLWSRQSQRYAQTATKVINAVKGAQTGVTRVQTQDLMDLFSSEGIPTTWTTVETSMDVDGVATRVLPADKIILGPSNPADLLEFQLGISATALELVDSNEAEMSFEDASGIVGVVEKVGPPYRKFTFVDAVGIPVLKDARKLMVLDVLP